MMGWMAPLRHRRAKLVFRRITRKWEPSMSEITTIGLDVAKHVFQVHGIDAQGTNDRYTRLRRWCPRGQSCHRDDSDRVWLQWRPGRAWVGRQPCPARRQRDRHQFFLQEVAAKRLRLLHDLIPNAVRIAVLVNPVNAAVETTTLREVQEAAPVLGLQIQVLKASTIGEIDAAFVTLAGERPDALFVAGDAFFLDRRVQFATLTARDRIPATYSVREPVAAGGLMSYGPDLAEVFRQIGVYTASILKGAKPADLPVLQSTKLEFVLNLQTARAFGIEVPPGVLSITDEVIE
jgi:ABC transporter substrate binding protein